MGFDCNGLVNIVSTPSNTESRVVSTLDVYDIIQRFIQETNGELKAQMNNDDVASCMQLPFFTTLMPSEIEPSDRTKH